VETHASQHLPHVKENARRWWKIAGKNRLRAQALELALIIQKPPSLKTLKIMLLDLLQEPTHFVTLFTKLLLISRRPLIVACSKHPAKGAIVGGHAIIAEHWCALLHRGNQRFGLPPYATV
jgi:hypothetical protein